MRAAVRYPLERREIRFSLFSLDFHSTKSGPDHLRMYNRQSPMMEQSLVDDARAAYDYGLASASSPPSTEFSFVDQRVPISRPAATPTTTTQATWFTPPTAHPFLNRSFSMPQPTTTFLPTDEQQQLAMATLLMQQQQQHWPRPAATSIYPGQPPFEQVTKIKNLLSSIDRSLISRTFFNYYRCYLFNSKSKPNRLKPTLIFIR